MQPVHKFPVLLPIFLFADKVSARRAQNKTKTEFLVFYAEPKPNLREAKVSKARARQNKNRENFSA
ncbi:MAG: hypothetical protein IKZ20_05560, partial [Bacteroidaceae bacterium]|nr:hypothetical protein [Bacteroidaceae bacterium]